MNKVKIRFLLLGAVFFLMGLSSCYHKEPARVHAQVLQLEGDTTRFAVLAPGIELATYEILGSGSSRQLGLPWNSFLFAQILQNRKQGVIQMADGQLKLINLASFVQTDFKQTNLDVAKAAFAEPMADVNGRLEIFVVHGHELCVYKWMNYQDTSIQYTSDLDQQCQSLGEEDFEQAQFISGGRLVGVKNGALEVWDYKKAILLSRKAQNYRITDLSASNTGVVATLQSDRVTIWEIDITGELSFVKKQIGETWESVEVTGDGAQVVLVAQGQAILLSVRDESQLPLDIKQVKWTVPLGSGRLATLTSSESSDGSSVYKIYIAEKQFESLGYRASLPTIHPPPVGEQPVVAVSASGDGVWAVAGLYKGTVDVLKREGSSWRRAAVLQTQGVYFQNDPYAVAISQDGRWIAAASGNGFKVWKRKWEAWEEVNGGLYIYSKMAWVYSITMSADASWLVASDNYGVVGLFHRDGEVFTQVSGDLRGRTPSISDDGGVILTNDRFNEDVSIYENNLMPLHQDLPGYCKKISSLPTSVKGAPAVLLSPSGLGSVTWGSNGQITLWERTSSSWKEKYSAPIDGFRSPVPYFPMAVFGDGLWVIVPKGDNGLRLISSNQQPIGDYNVRELPTAITGSKLRSVAISADGSWLFASDNGTGFSVWNVKGKWTWMYQFSLEGYRGHALGRVLIEVHDRGERR